MEDNKKINDYVQDLYNKKINYLDIPYEYRFSDSIVEAVKELKIVKFGKRGFDIINNYFFVESTVKCIDKDDRRKRYEKESFNWFLDFDSYYNFLGGDIYENACYYGYIFTNKVVKIYNINLDKINKTAFIDYTYDEKLKILYQEFIQNEIRRYEIIEKEKNKIVKSVNKIYKCICYDDFCKFIKKNKYYKDILIFSFIFKYKEEAFNNVFEYALDTGDDDLIDKLCLIYNPDIILEKYECRNEPDKFFRKRASLANLIEFIKKDKKLKRKIYFDEKTHYYIVRNYYYLFNKKMQSTCEYGYNLYFETFEEFVEYLDYDLSGCNFSALMFCNIDFSKYNTENMLFPLNDPYKNINIEIEKFYRKKEDAYHNYIEEFVVKQNFINSYGQIFDCYEYKFKYFFDYIFFLKNDLSNADLLLCDGLVNLADYSNIILTDAKIRSIIKDKAGIKYNKYCCNSDNATFLPSIKNETELTIPRLDVGNISYLNYKIYYLTDLHIMHRLDNCFVLEDIYFLRRQYPICLQWG